jgi:hypothetical protein
MQTTYTHVVQSPLQHHVRDHAGVPAPLSLTSAVKQARRERKILTHQQALSGAHLLSFHSSVCIVLSLDRDRSSTRNSVPRPALRLCVAAPPVAVPQAQPVAKPRRGRDEFRRSVRSPTGAARVVSLPVIPVAAGCLTFSSIT